MRWYTVGMANTMYKTTILFLAVIMMPLMVSQIPARTVQYENVTDPIEIIKDIADQNGIQQIDILAISHQESLLGELKVGDEGCSLGWFHINTCVHDGTKEIIGDVKKEAEWVAEKLLSYGYQEDRMLAIAKYNAPAYPNWEYANRVEQRKQYVVKYVER